MPPITAIGTTKAQWGEGPIWHEKRLFWVDIEGHLVIEYNPADDSERSWNVGARVGAVVPRGSGGLVIAGASGFAFLDPESGATSPITDPEADLPDNRFNDGKCDPAGRFWAGSMHLEKPRQPTAALYRLDRDLEVHAIFAGVTVSNGLAWNAAADTFFYIDTPTGLIEAFDYDREGGTLANRRTIADTDGIKGVPDGMAIDENDNLWVAMCHGGAILCFDSSTGALLERLEFPVTEVTAPAFGGEDLGDLYVTTGQSSNHAHEPLQGRLLRTRTGVRGVAAFAFWG
ncbi:MAG: SMP-30/gluconolactonase/LRE family protein [Verrucomicrobiales bacterium]